MANTQYYNGYNNYNSGYGNSYGSPYNHNSNYVSFNVPRTQQVYFHHNHENDILYGYDEVPVQANYDTATNEGYRD